MSKAPEKNNESDIEEKGERIAKVMARAGLCSRRDAEVWIVHGRVSVNGTVLKTPAFVVRPGDDVLVDNQPLPALDRTRLWRYHKPAGLVTSHRDEKDRQTVFSRLPPNLPRVVSVGRLDLNSEGLLLLTNDGTLARELELPARGWERRYRVRVHGRITDSALARLARGITVEGVHYGPIVATIDAPTGGATKANTWLAVTLTEGKNREIRKVMEHLGLTVNRLIRIAYGPFQLGPLEEGEVEEIPRHLLREQLGLARADDEKEDTRAGWASAKKPDPNKPQNKKPFAKGRAKSGGKLSGTLRARTDKKFGAKDGFKKDGFKKDGFKSGAKPDRARASDRPEREERSRPERSYPERPAGRPGNRDRERPEGRSQERSAERAGGRPEGRGGRPGGSRPDGGRPSGDRPRGDRPRGDRPRGGRPSGGPGGRKPGHKVSRKP